MTWLLTTEAFAIGFCNSLRASYGVWHLGRTIERTRDPLWRMAGPNQRIWHLWI